MSTSHAFAVTELRRERVRALDVFEAAIQEASDEVLERMLVALDKCPEYVQEGNWLGGPWFPGAKPRVRACPLSVLAFGGAPDRQEDLEEAERIADQRLAARGMSAATFRWTWNARLIPERALARQVDAQLTSRILKGREL